VDGGSAYSGGDMTKKKEMVATKDKRGKESKIILLERNPYSKKGSQ